MPAGRKTLGVPQPGRANARRRTILPYIQAVPQHVDDVNRPAEHEHGRAATIEG